MCQLTQDPGTALQLTLLITAEHFELTNKHVIMLLIPTRPFLAHANNNQCTESDLLLLLVIKCGARLGTSVSYLY